MKKKIYFFNTTYSPGGKFMRTINVVNQLNRMNIGNGNIFITNQLNNLVNSFIIFIKDDFTKKIKHIRQAKKNNNIIIVDILDWIDQQSLDDDIYDAPDLHKNDYINFIDVFICENEYVKNKYENKYKKPCFIIKHHYDERWHQLKKNDNNQEKLEVLFNGYVGHKNKNCLHLNKLMENKLVTNNVAKYGQYHLSLKAEEGLYNCHISIRQKDSWEYNHKPSIKMKTAAVLNCNIITTNDISIQELLKKVNGEDYPYLLHGSEYNDVVNMIKYAQDTYKTDIWYKGLEIMNRIKDCYDISNIVTDYYLPFFNFLFNKYC